MSAIPPVRWLCFCDCLILKYSHPMMCNGRRGRGETAQTRPDRDEYRAHGRVTISNWNLVIALRL